LVFDVQNIAIAQACDNRQLVHQGQADIVWFAVVVLNGRTPDGLAVTVPFDVQVQAFGAVLAGGDRGELQDDVEDAFGVDEASASTSYIGYGVFVCGYCKLHDVLPLWFVCKLVGVGINAVELVPVNPGT
jgi:hypothetical protein